MIKCMQRNGPVLVRAKVSLFSVHHKIRFESIFKNIICKLQFVAIGRGHLTYDFKMTHSVVVDKANKKIGRNA